MNVVGFLSELREQGIELRLDGEGTLVCDAPKGAVTPEIGARIREHKEEIIAFLAPLRRDHWASLVPIQPDGGRPAFFCFHGVGGNVLNYSPFAEALGPDQPLYGLQSVGLDGTTPPLTDLGAMADAYLLEIRQVQQSGPFFLGGGSMGGNLALETARRLRAEGEEIGLVILFDTVGPNWPEPDGSGPALLGSLTRRIGRLNLPSGLSNLPARIRHRQDIQQRHQRCRGYLERGEPIPLEHRFWYIEETNLKALEGFVVEPYDGEVVLIRGEIEPGRGPLADPQRGWTGLLSHLEIHAIEGKHATLVEQPALAEILARRLRQAQEAFH